MIVISSKNGIVGIKNAMDVLKAGGNALDAVEAGIYPVEENPEDHTVGYSGFPSVLGEVELDASIMDGRTLMAGSVGCVKGYLHPISIARKVMENLPHVFLVGPGAERFAAEMGFPQAILMSEDTQKAWNELLHDQLSEQEIEQLHTRAGLAQLVRKVSGPRSTMGTVNFIARDRSGDICTGVSTSGWGGKYPGRLGDSPVIGAGNYADNRYGGAACTGLGEMSIRAGTARSVILYMKMGLALEAAGIVAMQDLNSLGGPYSSEMNIIAIDRAGNPAGFSNNPQKTFIYLTDEMEEPVEVQRTFVEVPERWGAV